MIPAAVHPARSTVQSFIDVRSRSTGFCAPLETEDYVPQVASFASPPKWHLAHTTWFFEEMVLKKHLPDYQEFDSDFSFLFNSYYQSVGKRADRARRGDMTRPTVDRVKAYRIHVDQQMQLLLEQSSKSLEELVVLGLNHEQQHQELMISDLKYAFFQNPLFPVYADDADLTAQYNPPVDQPWVGMDEGIYEIGHRGDGFCFDNELGRHKVYLHQFSIANKLVTNGEYLEFLEVGGYDQFQYWLDEGWSWVQQEEASHPLYWKKQNDTWYQYTLAGLKPLDLDAILCHVSYYEANAFAHWKGLRLPTEFEWEAASAQFKWGDRWEWCESAYLPYPGFEIAPGALGEYNGKFMVNQMVLRGASSATSPGHSRSTYRNFFHPYFRWQFSGIRLVQ